MADRQRVMSFILNESGFAIRETIRDFFRQPNVESAIFYSMPESHGHAYIFDRESPRLRVNPRIDQHPLRRAAPGAPLAFANPCKSCGVAQACRGPRPSPAHLTPHA